MHSTSLLLLVAAAIATTPVLRAQVLPGDIGVTGFSTSAFGIATPPNVTAYATPGFQGSGAATSQAILHDPNAFSDFIVGGFGFVGRATITGPGAVSYTLITNQIGTASQMSWDWFGNIVVADAGTDQIRTISPAGVVTDVTTGPQPWGANVNAGAWNWANGDIVVGGNGGLYRIPFGTTAPVTIASALGGFVSGVAFDPATGDVLATVLTANRIIRVTSAGVVSDFAPSGTVGSPNALDVDANGDLLVGGTAGRIFRVPPGGPATLLATNTSPSTNVSGLSLAKGSIFSGSFGASCNATSGPATLSVVGPLNLGVPFSTRSVNHAPSAVGVAILGLSNTTYLGLPLPFLLDPVLGTANCFLNVSADATFVVITDAAGTMMFTLTPTAAFTGQRLFAQHTVLENVPGGFSFTNGVFVQF